MISGWMLNSVSYVSIECIMRFHKEIMDFIQEFTKDLWD